MTIDMSQFYQVFFEETAEHLANMEALLLDLDLQQPDAEQLNAIFRAAHSIKGSAGTFGFTDLAEVTHILENLLDRIRKGELALTVAMIDAFLAAGDVLKDLLAAHRGEGESDVQASAAIRARLSALTTADAAPAAAPAERATVAVQPTPLSDLASYDISFALDASAADLSVTIDKLLGELAALGTAAVVARPDLAADVWRLRLEDSSADADTLREIIEFVAQSDSIRVEPAAAPAVAEQSYGLFDEQAPALADAAAYGFFEPVAAPAPKAEEAYGLFAEEALAPKAEEAYGLFDADAPVAAAASTEAGDGSYGFFEAPAPVAEAAAVTLPAAAAVVVTAPVVTDAEVPKERRSAARSDDKAPKASAETSIRVGVERVDQLINLVGELVITQAMLAQAAADVDPVRFERLIRGLGQLERNTRDLQESVMSIRMMPISVVFGRFPRVVRDLSQKLGKQVELKTVGESTELDKGLIERISDPLNHLVRNSLDHGIEMPEQRLAAGKDPCGTVTLKAYQQSGNIVIEVGDDGAGLNRQKILAKARERGLPVSDSMGDHEVWMLIFEPGFSTADQVTEVSGRGVGMDVVKRNIAAMSGRIEIESMLGIGTRMTVRLPLTLAILDGMSVAVAHETYIIPLGYVIESLQPTREMIKSVSGVDRLLHVRGEYLPLVMLHEAFNISGATRELHAGIVVVIESNGVKAALFVDALVGQHQVVIKSLEANYRRIHGVSGATIMGDGHVALILDVAAIVDMAKSAMPVAA